MKAAALFFFLSLQPGLAVVAEAFFGCYVRGESRSSVLSAGCNVCQVLHYVKSPAEKKAELLKSARTADDVWTLLKSSKLRAKVRQMLQPLQETDAAASLLDEQQTSTSGSVRIELEDPRCLAFGHLAALGSRRDIERAVHAAQFLYVYRLQFLEMDSRLIIPMHICRRDWLLLFLRFSDYLPNHHASIIHPSFYLSSHLSISAWECFAPQ